MNRSITRSEIESVVKKPSAVKSLGPDSFTGKFYDTFKEELIPVILKLQKIEEEQALPNSFYKVSITLISKSDKNTKKKRKIIIGQYV